MAGKYGTFGVGIDLPAGVLERLTRPSSVLADVVESLFTGVAESGLFGEAPDERKARLQGEVRQRGRAAKPPADEWEVTEDGTGVRRVTRAPSPYAGDPREDLETSGDVAWDQARRREMDCGPEG